MFCVYLCLLNKHTGSISSVAHFLSIVSHWELSIRGIVYLGPVDHNVCNLPGSLLKQSNKNKFLFVALDSKHLLDGKKCLRSKQCLNCFPRSSPRTRFRWIQTHFTPGAEGWALDNVLLAPGCPWMCSGHGLCDNGRCV